MPVTAPLRLAQWVMFGAAALMFAPSLLALINGGIWSTDEFGHGPFVLAISLWLMWRRWNDAAPSTPAEPLHGWAWVTLLVAALSFMAGRALDIVQLEVGSLILTLIACVLMVRGAAMLKALRFPLFFMIFMVPLPGFLVDGISHAMKLAVSDVAERVMHLLGYPIARAGVILHIGQYQLLVADACAGMRTLFMLEAMGLLYLNLVRHSSLARNVALAILIVPISFTANVIRVVALSLITYHLGDEAGQGFLHGFAGMVLFLSALMLIIGADTLLRTGFRRVGVAA